MSMYLESLRWMEFFLKFNSGGGDGVEKRMFWLEKLINRGGGGGRL